MTPPRDPFAAVVHLDPYPYYADLVAHRPLHRDDGLGLWVASSAEAVTAVLTSDRCRVRPSAEPVPGALLESPAGEMFGRLVRMNDGVRHAARKDAVSATFEALDVARVTTVGRERPRALVDATAPQDDASRLTDFAFRLPAVVLEVLRHYAPVPATRRLVAEAGDGAGVEVKAGDAVFGVLAAANGDRAANPEPAELVVTRTAPAGLTFGVGPHAGPGTKLA